MPAPLVWLGLAALTGLIWAYSGKEEVKGEGYTPPDEDGGGGGDYDDGTKSGEDMPGGDPAPPPDVDCTSFPGGGGLPPPPGFDTGFDALPTTPIPEFDGKSWKDIMSGPMMLTPDKLTLTTQESAALLAEELGSRAFCAGYTDVSQDLFAQADAIRSWIMTSVW